MSYVDPNGLDVFLCMQPAFGIANNSLDHHWIKTDTAEAGMGGTRGNIPENQSGDMPGDPVQVVNHKGSSKEKGASCKVKRYTEFAGIQKTGSAHLMCHACATHMLRRQGVSAGRLWAWGIALDIGAKVNKGEMPW